MITRKEKHKIKYTVTIRLCIRRETGDTEINKGKFYRVASTPRQAAHYVMRSQKWYSYDDYDGNVSYTYFADVIPTDVEEIMIDIVNEINARESWICDSIDDEFIQATQEAVHQLTGELEDYQRLKETIRC